MEPQLSDLQRIGIGLIMFGLCFLTFGVILLFDHGFLALGNLLLVSGIILTVGLQRAFRFFYQSSNRIPTGFLVLGMFIVLVGWPIIGMIFELYGLFKLFGGFMPVLINYLRSLPIIGHFLMIPGIKQVFDFVCPPRSMV